VSVAPFVLPALALVRLALLATGVSTVSPHRLSAPGVPSISPCAPGGGELEAISLSLSFFIICGPSDFLREIMGEAVGDGVDIGAEDAAVVPDDADGTRRGGLAGVENEEELNEPSERSG
jgi:hypothetical protein